MELLVILTSFGLAGGFIARAKGSSFFIWFAISFFTPPFGLLAAIFYRREKSEPERQCPRCHKTHKLYVQVCNRCGEDMYLPPPETVRPGPDFRSED
ncbi:MAG: hypothetical protein ACR2K6_08980 [Solirubrobacterales bacterium]